MSGGEWSERFGVYVHVPFCARRCDYCAFATWTDRHHLTGSYLAALVTQLDLPLPPAQSVFFGGGTPSMVGTALMTVLDAIELAPGAEVTVECNPDNVTEALISAYVAAGVTRVSLGVQSMVPHVLHQLGRAHDPENVRHAVAIVRDRLPTFNLDLIYGSVGESLDDWRRTLDEALALEPPHVSAYALTVEAGTPLAADLARHPDDDRQAECYELAEAVLGTRLSNYEISNWAMPGQECRHNQLYWSGGDYLGVGCAAHSHRSGRRWWNVRTPDRYIALVEAGESVEAGAEELDAEQRQLEQLQLSLRTRDGVPIDALDLTDLEGLVEPHGTRVVLTPSGRLVANEISMRLRAAPLLDPGR